MKYSTVEYFYVGRPSRQRECRLFVSPRLDPSVAMQDG